MTLWTLFRKCIGHCLGKLELLFVYNVWEKNTTLPGRGIIGKICKISGEKLYIYRKFCTIFCGEMRRNYVISTL